MCIVAAMCILGCESGGGMGLRQEVCEVAWTAKWGIVEAMMLTRAIQQDTLT